MAGRKPPWVPDRQDVIWIDCNPQSGREMRDMHPFVVLSPQAFNDRTSLVIGLPMTTAANNADNPFAIPVGAASGKRASKASYVLGHQPKSIDWRARHAKPHPMKRLPEGAFREACAVLNQIVALA